MTAPLAAVASHSRTGHARLRPPSDGRRGRRRYEGIVAAGFVTLDVHIHERQFIFRGGAKKNDEEKKNDGRAVVDQCRVFFAFLFGFVFAE